METGLRKKKGRLVPTNHIDHIVISHNDNKFVDSAIGSSVSKDPYFKFKVAGAKADTIEFKYKDNLGKTGWL
jgi:sulfur-oxidizing protein SoxZ